MSLSLNVKKIKFSTAPRPYEKLKKNVVSFDFDLPTSTTIEQIGKLVCWNRLFKSNLARQTS
jgi:hypothetical protein